MPLSVLQELHRTACSGSGGVTAAGAATMGALAEGTAGACGRGAFAYHRATGEEAHYLHKEAEDFSTTLHPF